MRIGINILFLIPGRVGGTETYSRGLINSLCDRGGLELIVFGNKENKGYFNHPKIKEVTLPFSAENRPLRLFWENLILPFYCLFYRVEVLHSLGYTAPVLKFQPSIVTIFDLNWYFHPEDFGLVARKAWELFIRLAAHRADHIVTSSNFSKKSIQRLLKVDGSEITVVYPGVPEMPANISTIGIKRPFIFTATASYPHKNLVRLIEAFSIFSKRLPQFHLVISGLRVTNNGEMENKIKDLGLTDKIDDLGWVSKEQLAYLYKNCLFFIFPSLYEGFGFPVLEALSQGVPVASSRATSLPEVYGKAALTFDPVDTEQMAKTMIRLSTNDKLRISLSKEGIKQSKKFSWAKAGQECYKIYQKHVYNR